MKIKLLTYGSCIATLIFAFGLGSATNAHAVPVRSTMYVDDSRPAVVVVELSCPQEDSCVADYADGRWTVTRTGR